MNGQWQSIIIESKAGPCFERDDFVLSGTKEEKSATDHLEWNLLRRKGDFLELVTRLQLPRLILASEAEMKADEIRAAQDPADRHLAGFG